MAECRKTSRFFLSANTPQGLLTRYDRLYQPDEGWKAMILAGGAGACVSGILQKAGRMLEDAGSPVEYITSSIHSDRLDAVAAPDRKVCVIDSSPPHTLAAEYPGIVESVLNVGDFWDEEVLSRSRDAVLAFSARMNASGDRAYRFLSAASSLTSDTARLAMDCADSLKLENYAARLSKREFPTKGGQGRETLRFLTAVTPDGVTNLFDSVTAAYPRVFVIEDEYGIGKILVSKLRSAALTAGYDVVSCNCSLFPDEKPEHLLIPERATAFLTSSHYHRYTGPAFRHIHMRRFLDSDLIRLRRPRISFNRRASRQLIDESVLLLSDARASYDMIQSCYMEATDSAALTSRADEMLRRLISSATVG